MEQENIQYTGITQATSDLNCPDGDLSVSHNIINHNEAMRPIILPQAEFALESGEALLYVHTTSNYKNFIYQVGDSIKAFVVSGGIRKDYSVSFSLSTNETLNKIESVGNTLVLITNQRMTYLLWKENDYSLLGDSIPEVSISFGLKGEPIQYSKLGGDRNNRYGTFSISFDGISESDINKEFTEENKSKITDQVLAKVNKFIKEAVTDKGKFIYPFFVRYALRMFDGSLIHHSAPILMIPTTRTNPIVLWDRISGKGSYSSAELDIFSIICTLDYEIMMSEKELSKLLQWKDIAKSIDFFISEPIYTHDPNGTCKRFSDTDNFDGFMIGKLSNGGHYENASRNLLEKARTYYQKWFIHQLYSISHGGSHPDKTLEIPEVDKSQVNQKIKECSNFYFLSSIQIDSLSTGRKDVMVESEYLQNITLKERMTDDYYSHDRLIPEYSFIYNSRLNIANIRKELFSGYDSSSMSCYANGFMNYYSSGPQGGPYIENIEDYTFSYNVFCYTHINDDSRNIILLNKCSSKLSYDFGHFVFFPNTKANKMTIAHVPYNIRGREVALKQHKGLNGSYYFSNFEELVINDITAPNTAKERVVQLPNKLYTSEVGNPFLFPLEGINTIGVGQILGMASTTRALSQGQFGQFPLLVFATDGIWAMEVSPNGLYSVKQPISRDICSNPKSITQIDGAVIFISDKGAMIIDADQVNTFSAELDGPAFSPASVIQFDVIAEKEGLTKELSSLVPVKDFFMNCQIAYDYPNSRLLFINANKPYAYVYSLQSHSWATVTSSFTHVVTDYPHTYLQDNNRQIVNISSKIDYESDSRVKSVLLSRPIKLGDDMLKTINQVINRGNFEVDKINVVLFASTDGITYFPIGSAIGPRISGLCGSPYRYFRIAVISNFSAKESLSATSVYYTPKWRNKPR